MAGVTRQRERDDDYTDWLALDDFAGEFARTIRPAAAKAAAETVAGGVLAAA